MRRTPYTEIGIRRLGCVRCGEQAVHQWQVCADGNQYRPLCVECDIGLNKLVLQWMGFDDWQDKIEKYKENK